MAAWAEVWRAESERRRDEEAEVRLANKRAEHEAGVRRQKALLAELGVPDVSPDEITERAP